MRLPKGDTRPKRWLGLKQRCEVYEEHLHWLGPWFYDTEMWLWTKWRWVRHPRQTLALNRLMKSIPYAHYVILAMAEDEVVMVWVTDEVVTSRAWAAELAEHFGDRLEVKVFNPDRIRVDGRESGQDSLKHFNERSA